MSDPFVYRARRLKPLSAFWSVGVASLWVVAIVLATRFDFDLANIVVGGSCKAEFGAKVSCHFRIAYVAVSLFQSCSLYGVAFRAVGDRFSHSIG